MNQQFRDPIEFGDRLEPWETPESRARNEKWRGEAAAEAADIGRSGIPGGPVPALDRQAIENLFRQALSQVRQAMGLHAMGRALQAQRGQIAELEKQNQQIAAIQDWMKTMQAKAEAASTIEAQFAAELADIERNLPTVETTGVQPDFDLNLLYDAWE